MPTCEVVEDVSAASGRTLLVDDEPLIRFAMADALRELGVRAIEAATADEAWDYLMIDPLVDVVFTDHRMPGSMTGAQLATRITLQYSSMSVVVTSGFLCGNEWSGPVVRKPYDLFQTAADLANMATEGRQKRMSR